MKPFLFACGLLFFCPEWALTASLGGFGLGFSRTKTDQPDHPAVFNGFSLGLGLSGLIYGLGLRYFW